ncbi:hypothetical protein LJB86_04190 [Deltaproteobacteria bacterium OttesenSCG-928-M10]|nr:hypothetical protein [Deltaproteobacteria bacterium OttesenSCG-928-M10]
MPKSASTWEGRRALTDNPNAGAEAYRKAARELLDNNALSDAVVFFALADDQEGLREILDLAVRDGNYFIFQAAAARLKEKPAKDKALALASAAEKNGQILYAEKASQYIENYER